MDNCKQFQNVRLFITKKYVEGRKSIAACFAGRAGSVSFAITGAFVLLLLVEFYFFFFAAAQATLLQVRENTNELR